MKVGRNQPCPCGSGKKYKKCCLGKEEASGGNVNRIDYGRQRIRNTDKKVISKLVDFAQKRFGEEAAVEALSEFFLWREEEPDEELESGMMAAFAPWFVFAWDVIELLEDPEAPPESETDAALPAIFPEKTLAGLFLEEHPDQVNTFERRYIEEACEQAYGFFQVMDVVPGQALTLTDLLLNQTVTVVEQNASREEIKGKILYTKVITLEGTSVMMGSFPYLIPGKYKGSLIDFRQELEQKRGKLTPADLREFDFELREFYMDITMDQREQRMPQMQNTDSDPVVPTKLIYELACTPAEAFRALKTLAQGEDEKDLLADAEYGENGELAEISFPWLQKGNPMHKSWNNTVMGHIAISGNRMTVEVNSEKRAEKIRGEIRKRLKDRAEYKNAVLTSLEKMMGKRQLQENDSSVEASGLDHEELMQNPEIRQKIAEMAESHWEEWLDTRLPALDDMTPREAAKDRVGREKLEGLLLNFEASEQRNPGANAFAPDIEKLRQKLVITGDVSDK